MNPPIESASSDATELKACWKEIGVWGDGRCPELRAHTHCRNCPAFSSAASRLLDRSLPPGYRDEWSSHFVAKKADMALRTLSVLVFRSGSEALAIPMRVLQEVTEWRVVRTIPHRRQGIMMGLVNVRGELVVCASLELALDIGRDDDPQGPSSRAVAHRRMLIAKKDSDRFAFPVDEIFGISRISLGDIKDLPATVVHSGKRCVSGMISWRERSVGLLDEERLFELLNRSLG
ncbi:MAG: chemotaxis protein CheW [Verrucomicrobia bacterium]|nr:chemotaxis protein CheW [Verrucomicrobiota bacterium]